MKKIIRLALMQYQMIRKDWDVVNCIDGPVGVGKSHLGLWNIHYHYTFLNGQVTEEDIKHMCLDDEQFTSDLKDLQKFERTAYDEAGQLTKRRALSDFNVKIMQAYQVIRGDNLITDLILPSIFDLDSYFSRDRVKGLLHVFQRGRVAYYSQKRLKTLIGLNRALPVKNYLKVKPTWVDTFPIYRGPLLKPYNKKKAEKMKVIRERLYQDMQKKVEKETRPKAHCPRCAHTWTPKVENPSQCPGCGTRLVKLRIAERERLNIIKVKMEK